jgi:uncharacterized OsmC-like protein
VGFVRIVLRFELDADLSDEELATLIATTERYCVVYQTLAAGVPVSMEIATTR